MNRPRVVLGILLAPALCLLAAVGASASDGRIPLLMCPSPATISIVQAGDYYLAGDISFAGGTIISIQADHVVLDLGGFTVSSTSTTAFLIDGSGHYDVRVTNGKISGGYVGLRLSGINGPVTLDHLTLVGQSATGMELDFTGSSGDYCTGIVEDNTVSNSGTTFGMYIDSMSGGRVARNSIRGGELLIQSSSNVTVTDNVVSESPSDGIHLSSGSNGNNIRRNTVNHCTGAGIILYNSSRNSLTWNLCAANGGYGIDMDSGADHNIYAYNRARGNTGGGIVHTMGTNVDGGGNQSP